MMTVSTRPRRVTRTCQRDRAAARRSLSGSKPGEGLPKSGSLGSTAAPHQTVPLAAPGAPAKRVAPDTGCQNNLAVRPATQLACLHWTSLLSGVVAWDQYSTRREARPGGRREMKYYIIGIYIPSGGALGLAMPSAFAGPVFSRNVRRLTVPLLATPMPTRVAPDLQGAKTGPGLTFARGMPGFPCPAARVSVRPPPVQRTGRATPTGCTPRVQATASEPPPRVVVSGQPPPVQATRNPTTTGCTQPVQPRGKPDPHRSYLDTGPGAW